MCSIVSSAAASPVTTVHLPFMFVFSFRALVACRAICSFSSTATQCVVLFANCRARIACAPHPISIEVAFVGASSIALLYWSLRTLSLCIDSNCSQTKCRLADRVFIPFSILWLIRIWCLVVLLIICLMRGLECSVPPWSNRGSYCSVRVLS